MGEHALLSASSASRWLACSPSARLEEQLPEKASEHAEEGTLAHALCELKLRKLFTDTGMTKKKYTSEFNKIKKNKLYKTEMDRYTDIYIDYISSLAYGGACTPYLAVEKRVDYSHIAPEGFGTADCIMIHGSECRVIDFKYGKGVPVSAEDNPQMKLYALGAVHEYDFLYPIEKVILTVVQPRLDSISEWEATKDALESWGESIKPAAGAAFKGEGEFHQGEHCRFCKAAGTCRHQADENTQLISQYCDPVSGVMLLPPLLTDVEVGAVLHEAKKLKDWVKKIESYALGAIVAGRKVPGWKIVEGRSNRAYKDQEAAFAAVKEAGYEEALLYEKKPIPLTELEGLIGKEVMKKIVSPFIEKPPGKPTLAPDVDSRPAMELKSRAAEDFKEEDNING